MGYDKLRGPAVPTPGRRRRQLGVTSRMRINLEWRFPRACTNESDVFQGREEADRFERFHSLCLRQSCAGAGGGRDREKSPRDSIRPGRVPSDIKCRPYRSDLLGPIDLSS
jgi:hypothetical protein